MRASDAKLNDWAIAGGEFGPKARPMGPGWAPNIRDSCQRAGVRFFLKQWGGKNKKEGGWRQEARFVLPRLQASRS